MAKKILAVVFGFVLAPAFISADHESRGLSGAFGNQIVGEPCAVRVYHVNFNFPPQGGKIVQYGNELYFIRTYQPGCEQAGSTGNLLVASPSGHNPLQTNNSQNYVHPMFTSVTGNQVPVQQHAPTYVAPTTGGSSVRCY
jgi:hypothetical protein